jgi:hypothetical protein
MNEEHRFAIRGGRFFAEAVAGPKTFVLHQFPLGIAPARDDPLRICTAFVRDCCRREHFGAERKSGF